MLGFSADADISVHEGLAGEAVAVGLALELAFFDLSTGGEIFHALDYLHNAGATLTVAATVEQFARELIEIVVV